jgi:hypothetical protein
VQYSLKRLLGCAVSSCGNELTKTNGVGRGIYLMTPARSFRDGHVHNLNTWVSKKLTTSLSTRPKQHFDSQKQMLMHAQ